MASVTEIAGLEALSDMFVVSSEGARFPVHKVFLARFSLLFREMFASDEGGAQQGCHQEPGKKPELQLSDLNSKELEALIRCTVF